MRDNSLRASVPVTGSAVSRWQEQEAEAMPDCLPPPATDEWRLASGWWIVPATVLALPVWIVIAGLLTP